jgi:hypothetical protein
MEMDNSIDHVLSEVWISEIIKTQHYQQARNNQVFFSPARTEEGCLGS